MATETQILDMLARRDALELVEELLKVRKDDRDRLAVHKSSARHDWQTPPEVFRPLMLERQYRVDAAANERNHLCDLYMGPGGFLEDALAQPWPSAGPYWCNPPYGAMAGRFVAKAAREARRGRTTDLLVAARTDVAWWHRWVMRHATRVRLIEGRITFLEGGEPAPHPAPFPSAVVTFSPFPGPPVFETWTPPKRPRGRVVRGA